MLRRDKVAINTLIHSAMFLLLSTKGKKYLKATFNGTVVYSSSNSNSGLSQANAKLLVDRLKLSSDDMLIV